MWFKRGPGYRQNNLVRLVAALVVMGMTVVGLGALPTSLLMPILAIEAVIVGGLAWQMWRERDRRDKYDLTRLRMIDNALQEPDEMPEGSLLYCHRCGASMSDRMSICPGCGAPLGT